MDRLAPGRHDRGFPPGPIDTSTLGPVRFNPQAEPGRVQRAQETVEEYIDPSDILFPKALQAALDFEQCERKRRNG